MKTAVIGYPRVGSQRELKFVTEKFFRGDLQAAELLSTAAILREKHWRCQQEQAVDYISCNDFSLYDGMLDMAMLFNVIPARYRQLGLDELQTYFAMARGYQGAQGDVKALAMKKWFNTNYHYMVPELEADARITLAGDKPFAEYSQAQALGIKTKPVFVGPYTFLKLLRPVGGARTADVVLDLIQAYRELLERFAAFDAEWVQFDEPALVLDMTTDDKNLLVELYTKMLATPLSVRLLVQTYFGDVRDCYRELTALPIAGIGLDFVEGRRNLELVEQEGFPRDKVLFAGLINGKNIWRNSYEQTVKKVQVLQAKKAELVINTSCSLLHVPYSLREEQGLQAEKRQYFAFAEEKLAELAELKEILSSEQPTYQSGYKRNRQLFLERPARSNPQVQERIQNLQEQDFVRQPSAAERFDRQRQLGLPLFPATTIGSFPQTAKVRAARASFRKGKLPVAEYEEFLRGEIRDCIRLQEEIGLDVLVHGEFERNDMVEYFGENLEGYLFTTQGWVQSYGTRCVKPPIIWGDVARSRPMTVEYAAYAQSLTDKPVKGMLTGPVTLLNWSFPREDISFQESLWQLALAIRDEVLDLEAHKICIIQIDEAALREKLPLRRADWHTEYLEAAVQAFRLVHSGVKADTQIHTHMCYSEFNEIIRDIDRMDADVISFEASRSDLKILHALKACGFQTQVGPGVYDIHSPRVPGQEEIETALRSMLQVIPKEKLWVNPDCGLKTRGEKEVKASLLAMVAAAGTLRSEYRK